MKTRYLAAAADTPGPLNQCGNTVAELAAETVPIETRVVILERVQGSLPIMRWRGEGAPNESGKFRRRSVGRTQISGFPFAHNGGNSTDRRSDHGQAKCHGFAKGLSIGFGARG